MTSQYDPGAGRHPQDGVDIIPFEDRYAGEFRQLNLEWLNRYFRVEALDEEVLSRPHEILRDGGAIFLARYRGKIVGTCALLRAGEGRFELGKMAVTAGCQGMGIGRMLLEAVIGQFRAVGGRQLFLESNSRLRPAITLYQSAGFVRIPAPTRSYYERADVYMVYRPAPAEDPV